MVLAAFLIITGHETASELGIPLLTCNYSFSQETDERGLPKSIVKGGLINLSFNSLDDEEIMAWMMSPQTDKDGEILFMEKDDEKVFKTLRFINARCVYYHESFVDSEKMIQELTISARIVMVSGSELINTWTKYKG